MHIKKGQLITFAEGEYSDYCVNGLCVALKDFNLDEVVRFWELGNTYTKKHPYQSRDQKLLNEDGVEFLAFLNASRLVEDVDYIEVHTGSYDEVLIDVTKNAQTKE